MRTFINIKSFVAFLFVAAFNVAFAETYTWAAGNGDFATLANWKVSSGATPDVLPGAEDDVIIPSGDVVYTNTVSSPFTVKSLEIGGGSKVVVLEFKTGPSEGSTVSGNLHMKANSKVTHCAGAVTSDVPNYTVNLKVGGNMTIDGGASIDVTGKGYPAGKCPAASISGGSSGTSYGPAHGGQYHPNAKAYDSALEPSMYGASIGSGKAQYYGGGVVKLDVDGELKINDNGKIVANATTRASKFGGSGGAIWIIAGKLIGSKSAIISADGGDSQELGGAGGRIAIYQTNESTVDFSSYEGRRSAYGSKGYVSKNKNSSSAGTVYLHSFNDGDKTKGTLVIDNNNAKVLNANTSTPLLDKYGCGEVGNLIVRNGAYVDVGSDTLEVYGDITVSSATLKAYSGDIQLCGDKDAVIKGTAEYSSFSCLVPGKKIYFGTSADDNFKIADGSTLTLKGSESQKVELLPLEPEGTWKITMASTAKADVENVKVVNSDASSGAAITAKSSDDGGGNNNWVFQNTEIEPGETITWNGSVDGEWATVANWTDKNDASRMPIETDKVVIPADCANYPKLTADTLLNSIEVATGAAITLSNGKTLTVTNNFTLSGSLTMTGTEKVIFNGKSLDFSSGTVNAGNSIFTIDGKLDQTLNFGGNTLRGLYVRKSGGAANFTGSVDAEVFDALATNAYSLVFSQDVAVSAKHVYCRSRPDDILQDIALLSLVSATEEEKWGLAASDSALFSGVKVRDSNATSLIARAGAGSVDLGGNSNWIFDANVAEWIGGTGDFDTPGNWYPAAVPAEDADILITGIEKSAAVTAQGNVTARKVTIGGGAAKSSLTVKGVLTVGEDLLVETNATITLNSPVQNNAVGRDFILRNGSTATHLALPNACSTEASVETSGYRFRVKAGRNIIIEKGAKIDASGKGYASYKGPLSGKTISFDSDGDGVTEKHDRSGTGPGHASFAVVNNEKAFILPNLSYGSMYEPLSHGSGGDETRGGGSIYISATGDITLAGDVLAEGLDKNKGPMSGAGGSIWIDAGGTLSGKGTISSMGGVASTDCGSGGRIALYYGEKTFIGSLWAQSRQTFQGGFTGGGTILQKLKSSSKYEVEIAFSSDAPGQNQTMEDSLHTAITRYSVAQIPSAGDVGRKSELKNTSFKIGFLSNISLRDNLTIYDIDVAHASRAYVRLNGCTLKVLSSKHKDGKGWARSYDSALLAPGRIVWSGGFAISVK